MSLMAYDQSNYIDIDQFPVECRENPEKILLRKEKRYKLSKEARAIIDIIVEAPEELQMLFNADISAIEALKIFLRWKKWNNHKIEKRLKELRKFTREELC